MHIKNESLKQYTEGIKVIFQRCQHKCEVSLFTKHLTNVAEVALQTHKEGKSGTPMGSSTATSKGKAGERWGRTFPLHGAYPPPWLFGYLQARELLESMSIALGSPQHSSGGEIIIVIVYVIISLIYCVTARGLPAGIKQHVCGAAGSLCRAYCPGLC